VGKFRYGGKLNNTKKEFRAMSEIDNIIKNLKKMNKKTIIFSMAAACIFVIVLIISIVFISHSIKTMKIEVEGFKFQIEEGIQKIDENLEQLVQMESGNSYRIELKEDAFAVIDDTNIELDNGLDDIEIEEALDNHKYSGYTKIDGDLSDQKENVEKFNYMWGIEEGWDIDKVFNHDFKDRLSFTHRQHTYRIDWDYFNQRDTPDIGYIICVPSSAVILFNALSDTDIEVMEVVNYFAESKDIENYACAIFGDWIEKYIKENKLYQITGIFTYGFNLFLEDNFPEFEYHLDYDYWTVLEIVNYIESFGLMSATYLPSYVREGTRTGGHMITITKAYYNNEGDLMSFGINDPFGNPNVAYRGNRGYDGKNVIVNIDTMRKVMKSYRDDHGKGASYLYRVLFFENN
jgi:hypothetical protein